MWQSCMLSLCVCVKLLYVKDGMWQRCVCVWSYVCDRWYVTKLCVKFVCVKLLYVKDVMWQSCVCEVMYVTDGMWQSCVLSLCVCAKYGMWQSCMLSLCVWGYCMWEMVCGRRKEAGGGRREAGAARDTESKTRTPHKVVGNKAILRDIHKKWKFTAPKWYMSAGLLQNSKFARSKTKQFCKTSFKNEKLSAELTASCQCGLWFLLLMCQKHCACHGKAARSYKVLHLSHRIMLKNLPIRYSKMQLISGN